MNNQEILYRLMDIKGVIYDLNKQVQVLQNELSEEIKDE